MAKATPLPIKVAIYHRIINGDISRVVAKDFRISQPTALKYAADVIEMLRGRDDVESAPSLRAFMARTIKNQSFQYADEPEVRALLEPILAPYLAQAETIDFAEREGADNPLSTRVNATTFERFQGIVAEMSVDRPDLTPSELLREIVESFCEQAVVPAPTVNIADPKHFRDALTDSITDVLRKFGISGV
ncbi:hypothetical protein BSFA1_82000 (plasmid) [Burkholderia sp. SFA1]|uniref:Uncharacterized protein n=1 Tax=Burkholderia vietnamiensis (strain G4 / LMG 22486) TaxID=269482 RepID=A4JTL8_BURVG|nr:MULTISPECIES: hypothetical protein [Caballeronia]ABO59621.1 hypothetical protein Bcep1808_6733 [Burkholderia vietnamiensis G4]AET95511.1 hypothetical protein BYI23_E003500 [Burkholderia sp. YI23]MCB4350219.1 hypothetical protein [Burkholderia vietnamiensis]BBQ03072.1 hypothetical protein BSFA1_82000 [Burkholderia sp. SFA1]MDR5799245.1 hypothetical protein [Caballeronia sp. LZ001]